LEKRIVLAHLQNTVHVSYHVNGSAQLPRLELRPAFQFRHYESPVDEAIAAPYKLTVAEGRYEIAGTYGDLPPVRMRLHGCSSSFRVEPTWIHQVIYRTELDRGYAFEGDLWSPGAFEADLAE